MPRPSPSISGRKIISSLRSIARTLKRSPHKVEFLARSGISQHQFEKNFDAWNDALAAANLAPNIPTPKSNSELLEDWANVARKLGRCPSIPDYRSNGGRFGVVTFRSRFKSWRAVRRVFYKHAAGDKTWEDVLKIIRERESRCTKPWLITPGFAFESPRAAQLFASDSITYGEPLDFEFLRNAPVNEAGVIYLFGCLAPKLGYVVEAIQTAFPDCEAKRRDPDGRFRRVRIEFEFESRNFLLHGHDAAACDVIVCWRDNWPECPLQVVELSRELGAMKRAAA